MVNTAFNAFEAGTPEVVIDEVVSICNQFNIYTEQVCRGTAEKALVRHHFATITRSLKFRIGFLNYEICLSFLNTIMCI